MSRFVVSIAVKGQVARHTTCMGSTSSINCLKTVLRLKTGCQGGGQNCHGHTASTSDRVERWIIVLHADLGHLLGRHIVLVSVLSCRRGVSVLLPLINGVQSSQI